MNKQIPVSFVESFRDELLVHSIFYTIQGEGPFSGQRAVFVRLAGCNLQCPACDTEYTEGARTMTRTEIRFRIWELVGADGDEHPLVVITGGEPFRQSGLWKLVGELIAFKARVQIETNGSFDVSQVPVETVIVVSPKTGKVHPSVIYRANAYKYVVDHTSIDPEDGLPIRALEHSCGSRGVWRPPYDYKGTIYIQPMDVPGNIDSYELNVKACVESCMKFGYTLQLQVHKLVGVE